MNNLRRIIHVAAEVRTMWMGLESAWSAKQAVEAVTREKSSSERWTLALYEIKRARNDRLSAPACYPSDYWLTKMVSNFDKIQNKREQDSRWARLRRQ